MSTDQRRARLTRLVLLSISAALATIGLKLVAWRLTGSVGLLADAAESLTNLFAAIIALIVVLWSTRPPDEEHPYGHEKADYLSAGIEGTLIVVAAGSIAVAAVQRLLDPSAIESVGVGALVSAGATLINLGVGTLLIREGRKYQSILLEADGKHLLTDVWTSIGVLVAVVLIALTGWNVLDPIIALVVAANILWVGTKLVRESTGGLMDKMLPPEELALVGTTLDRYRVEEGIEFHALRTRRSGWRVFISVHVLVPGDWTVQHGHDLVERVEADLRAQFGQATIFTHLEPIEDPASFADTQLDAAPSDTAPRPTS